MHRLYANTIPMYRNNLTILRLLYLHMSWTQSPMDTWEQLKKAECLHPPPHIHTFEIFPIELSFSEGANFVAFNGYHSSPYAFSHINVPLEIMYLYVDKLHFNNFLFFIFIKIPEFFLVTFFFSPD